MKCIIIDDEKNSRDLIRKVIEKYNPEIDIIGEAEGVMDAYDIIKEEKKIDLMFLDVQMADGTGFDLLNLLPPFKGMRIVFVTAHKDFAIDAFKIKAFDYILKPLSIKDIVHVLTEAKTSYEENIEKRTTVVVSDLDKTITINDANAVELIKSKDIVYIQADGNYSIVYFENNTKKSYTKTIKELEEILNSNLFYRVHNSFLVNKLFIKKMLKADGGSLVLTNETEIPVSRRIKKEFIQWLSE